jgi:hypothetical protein
MAVSMSRFLFLAMALSIASAAGVEHETVHHGACVGKAWRAISVQDSSRRRDVEAGAVTAAAGLSLRSKKVVSERCILPSAWLTAYAIFVACALAA